MITRQVGLNWIEARLNYISKIETRAELDVMAKVFQLDLDYLLHEHSLISLAEHDVLMRRAALEIALHRKRLGRVLRFPIPVARPAYVLRGEV